MTTGYQYQSDFAKKYFGEGLDQGLDKGREEGLDKGREEGREKGREEGMRSVLARQLERLGVELDTAMAEKLATASLPALEGIADDLVARSTDPGAILDSLRHRLAMHQS